MSFRCALDVHDSCLRDESSSGRAGYITTFASVEYNTLKFTKTYVLVLSPFSELGQPAGADCTRGGVKASDKAVRVAIGEPIIKPHSFFYNLNPFPPPPYVFGQVGVIWFLATVESLHLQR